jgi:hypothetical protein
VFIVPLNYNITKKQTYTVTHALNPYSREDHIFSAVQEFRFPLSKSPILDNNLDRMASVHMLYFFSINIVNMVFSSTPKSVVKILF